MRLELVRLSDFRGFVGTEWRPGPALNLITGANGAGKTSLLEAPHLIAHGRSFRARVNDGLIRRGQPHLDVLIRWVRGERHHQAGLRHSGKVWKGRLDQSDVGTLSELCAALAVISYEPGSQALIAGNAEGRRRFLDWTLFHVEPDFVGQWRRYTRALRQRNQLLKERAGDSLLGAWEIEMADTGERMSVLRANVVARLLPRLLCLVDRFLPELGRSGLSFSPGWKQEQFSLIDSLAQTRDRDRLYGHTGLGPHRADWRVEFQDFDARSMLSRGQTKLLALCCLLAQSELLAEHLGEPAVLCLDDLASELDAPHLARVIEHLVSSGAQALITGTHWPDSVPLASAVVERFHVEHGQVHTLRG